MFEDIIKEAFNAVMGGGPSAIIAISLCLNIAFGYAIMKLWTLLNKRDEKIDKIIADFSTNNITITEALNGLKMVLIEIKAKI